MNTSAYIVARVSVTDQTVYSEYMKHTPRVVGKFGGRFIARSPDPVTLEGEIEERRIVIIEFPSMDEAKAFYQSEEYTEIMKLRQDVASAQFVAVEGFPAEDWDRILKESRKLEK